MQTIHLTSSMAEEAQAELPGRFLEDTDYDQLITDSAIVYRPDGRLLLKFFKKVLSPAACRMAFYNLRQAAEITENRGIAAGLPKDSETFGRYRVRQDGSVSQTRESLPVESGIVGFFDRYVRIPFCRQTAFNANHPEKFSHALPLLQEVSELFRQHIPDRYAAQAARCAVTQPEWVIPGTVFTTVTVNRNFRTATHKDQGDLVEGFGTLVVFRAGQFTGGRLVLPAFRVAVELDTRDCLFFDVHEFHGNTPIVGVPGRYERLSLVLYYREQMHRCGTLEEELARAKARQRGDPIYDPMETEPTA
jgi:hypothetical protein